MQMGCSTIHNTLAKKSLIALFFTLTALAGAPDQMAMPFAPLIPKNFAHNIEAFITSGVALSGLSNGNQTVIMNSLTSNTYDTSKSTQAGTMDGVGMSTIYHFNHHINVTLGPSFYFTDLGDVKGIEHPYSNAGNFQTLNYQFSAHSFSLLLESRAIYAAHRIQPFVIAGIGAAWNKLFNYSEVPTDPNSSATGNPNVFQNNTRCDFSYDVGLGAQTQIYNDMKHDVTYNAALSYRYFNFGSGALAQSSVQTGNQTLKINTLDTQAVLLSLTAEFN